MSLENVYDSKINKVLEYIDNNYFEEVTLEKMSRIAGFSYFHFQRIFKARIGESLYSYAKRVRINKAAYLLKYNKEKSITEIAFDCGFQSSSDFTRAFKEVYSLPPNLYRKSKNHIINKDALKYTPPLKNSYYDKNVSVRKFHNERIAFIRTKGLTKDFENDNIQNAFQELIYWGQKNNLIHKKTKYYGMIVDNPEITDMCDCRYFACITIDKPIHTKDTQIDTKVMNIEGEYVCYLLERQRSDFVSVFFEICDYLYGRYLVDHNMLPDDRPFLERYARDDSGNILIELCIPIIRKKQDL
jgi:AraC family transcriptional regulator